MGSRQKPTAQIFLSLRQPYWPELYSPPVPGFLFMPYRRNGFRRMQMFRIYRTSCIILMPNGSNETDIVFLSIVIFVFCAFPVLLTTTSVFPDGK